MKKKLILILIILSTTFVCCLPENKDVDVEITNVSKLNIDSLRIYVYPSFDTTVYNFYKGRKFKNKIKFRDIQYVKGEKPTSSITVYSKNKVLRKYQGFIDYPYGKIDDKYEYYICEDQISLKK